MFARIAPRYDLANDVLSLGIHRNWREKVLNAGEIGPGHHVLDLCTGTGDLAFAIAKRVTRSGYVAGVDFVNEMVQLATKKLKTRANSALNSAPISFMQGDALALPFSDQSFDRCTVSFGIRNVDSPVNGLREMERVLKPQGKAVVLEFGQPTAPGFSSAYQLYSKFLMPTIGGLLTGDRAAYEYLPRTSKNFPCGENFCAIMREAGFRNCKFKSLSLGIAYLYVGDKG